MNFALVPHFNLARLVKVFDEKGLEDSFHVVLDVGLFREGKEGFGLRVGTSARQHHNRTLRTIR